jgi:hypothetical protein
MINLRKLAALALTVVGATATILSTSTLSVSTASASPTAAYVDPGYRQVDVIFNFNGAGYAGDYISCPQGTKAVSSGSVLSAKYGGLLNGVTTYDGNGAYSTGFSGFGDGALQVTAHCVDAAHLAGAALSYVVTRTHRTGFHSYVKTPTCPTGTVPYGGGGWVDDHGTPVASGMYNHGSYPTARGWTVAMTGDLTEAHTMMASTHCLPRSRFGKIVTVTDTVTGPNTGTLTTVQAGARCPAGYFAFAGGAWFHSADSTFPVWRGYLWVSTMAADDQGWYAQGQTFQPGTQLSAVVRCTTRLG